MYDDDSWNTPETWPDGADTLEFGDFDPPEYEFLRDFQG